MVREDAEDGGGVSEDAEPSEHPDILSLDVAESLSLQEGCARHGWAPGKYRMLEYACRSGLLERMERELPALRPVMEFWLYKSFIVQYE